MTWCQNTLWQTLAASSSYIKIINPVLDFSLWCPGLARRCCRTRLGLISTVSAWFGSELESRTPHRTEREFGRCSGQARLPDSLTCIECNADWEGNRIKWYSTPTISHYPHAEAQYNCLRDKYDSMRPKVAHCNSQSCTAEFVHPLAPGKRKQANIYIYIYMYI